MNIVLWVLQGLLALAFIGSGGSKLAGVQQMVDLYNTLGTGQWFRYLTAAIELVAAVLLLIPGRAVYGAALLIATMIGAVIAHVAVLHTSPVAPLVLLLLSAIVFWGRRGQLKLGF